MLSLQSKPRIFLRDSRVEDIGPGKGRAFHHDMEKDIKSGRSATYILTGGVGSGKTTFLKRYARFLQPGLIKTYCIWAHIDFLPLGTTDKSLLTTQLEAFTYSSLREILKMDYSDRLPATGTSIRELFTTPIAELKLTRLYGVKESSEEWNRSVNELVESLFKDDKSFVEAFLHDATRKGRRIVVVLDNSDQLGEAFQEALFLFSKNCLTNLTL